MAWWAYPTNVTGFGSYITWMNTVSGGIIGDLILIATFIISFMAMSSGFSEHPEKSLVASGLISSVIGVLLFRIGIVDILLVYVAMFLTVVGFIWSFSRRESGGI